MTFHFFVYIYPISFIYSSIDINQGWLHILASVISAIVDLDA